MNVGPLAPAQPGSRGAFAFNRDAAYPYGPSTYYQAAPYHHDVTPQPPHAYSTQTRASQAFSPGPQGGGYHGGHAAMASTGGNMMMTAQAAAARQPHPSTTAPYSQSVPARAPTGPLPQLARHTASASPPKAASSSQQTSPNQYPMAAPPLPKSPANPQQQQQQQQQAAAQSASPSSPQTPQSPGSQSREQQRVALVLEINTDMLQEVNRLQTEGKGGATTPQIQAQMKAAGQPAELASEEYIQVLRRVQANLGYLMPVAQNDAQKTPRGPAYMSPPPHMPQLRPKFDQLRELFPDWQGLEPRMSQASMSPGTTSMGGANGAPPAVQT